jgi:hypothetical protein
MLCLCGGGGPKAVPCWIQAVSGLLGEGLFLTSFMAWAQPKHPAVKRLGASTAHGVLLHCTRGV